MYTRISCVYFITLLVIYYLIHICCGIFYTHTYLYSSLTRYTILLYYIVRVYSLLYLAGKGDSNVHIHEFDRSTLSLFPLSEYKSTTPNRGLAVVPKVALSCSKCEVGRLLKLTSTAIEPISVVVPRLANGFQSDLFPDTIGDISPHNYDRWRKGSNLKPEKISLKLLYEAEIHAQQDRSSDLTTRHTLGSSPTSPLPVHIGITTSTGKGSTAASEAGASGGTLQYSTGRESAGGKSKSRVREFMERTKSGINVGGGADGKDRASMG